MLANLKLWNTKGKNFHKVNILSAVALFTITHSAPN